jgi:ribonuclease P protein component
VTRAADAVFGRLLQSADFERVLAVPPRSRSAHFAVHHLAARPTLPAAGRRRAGKSKLSTEAAPVCPQPVDESPAGWWLGAVVPKRHARRAVTRNLIKRQIRGVMAACLAGREGEREPALPHGLWVVRLRSPFDLKTWPSAASDALRQAARAELAQLLDRAASRAGR